MRLSPDQIAGMRQDYSDRLPVADIRRKYGVSEGTVYYWTDGGGKKSGLAPLPRRSTGRPSARISRPKSKRVALVQCVWRAAEAQVREIEKRLRRHEQQPDERERDARTLAVLVKTLRELAAFDEASASKARTDQADDDPVPTDIDEFRRELARRIHSFVDQRAGTRVSGEPEG